MIEFSSKILLILCMTIALARSYIQNLISFNKVNSTERKLIDGFVDMRAGNPAIWHYSGVMRSPMSGLELAGVEGVEFIKQLNSSSDGRCYQSKKVFIYTKKSNHSEPIRKYRLTRIAPMRDVKYARHVDEIVTIKCNNDRSKDGYIALVEFPANRKIETSNIKIIPQKRQGVSGIIESIFKQTSYDVITFLSAKKKSKYFANKWISFQSINDMQCGKSQEYYNIKTTSTNLLRESLLFKNMPIVKLSYKRYGEAPPWVALGKPCVIELSGTRYTALAHLPENIKKLINQEFGPKYLEDQIKKCNPKDFQTLKDPMEEFAPWYKKYNPFKFSFNVNN